jgi:hypothetical protein
MPARNSASDHVSGFDARLRIEGQEVTVIMKTITLVFAVASALFAHAPKANARPAEKRGTVEVTGHAVKAVTTGPVLLHGYSGFSGGAIFVAQAGADADADCAAALADHRSARPIPLVADRVAYVPVAAGQVACLVTNTPRSFELLWHAFATDGSKTYLVAKSR